MTFTFLSPLHYWLADFQALPTKHCGILPSQHTTILPWQLLQTNYYIFMNVEILKRNVLFQDFFFLVKENIELSGTIFEVKTSKFN
jgi:hypothetical protein